MRPTDRTSAVGALADEAADRFRRLFQQSGLAQALVDLDGIVQAINDEVAVLAGRPCGDLVGQPLLARLPEQERAAAAATIAHVIGGDQRVLHIERRYPHADGSLRDLLISVAGLRDTSGAVTELAVSLQDVTDLRQAQRDADRERAWWQSLSEHASEVAFILDRDLNAQYASPSVTKLLGHDNGTVVGVPFLDLVHPHDRDRVGTSLLQLVTDQSAELTFQFRLRDAAGNWRTVEQRALNLVDHADVGGLVLNLTDVTDRHELERNLRQAVLNDRLTGLPNRALTLDRLQQALEHRDEQRRCTLLLVDIDHFSAINDAYGYAGGDQVLCWAADTLTAAVDPADTVGRYGADQFAVLLGHVTDTAAAEELARSLTRSLKSTVELAAGTSIRVSACVGLAHSRMYGADAVVSAAENALARAKTRGRGQCDCHDSAFTRGLSGRSLGAELAAAVTTEQLTVHYQPIVELQTGTISGFEALVRWPHQQLGFVPPDTFLPIAESLGLLVGIDQWVLAQACAAAHRWANETGRPSSIAVNVSPDRLLSPDFVNDVRDTLLDTALGPNSLVLEVTETAVVTDLHLAAHALNQLRELGVTVSIDDFGTGYSSMLQLRQLPFAKLKIDREFVRGLPGSADDLAICASVLSLAQRLDVRSIAEGVETAEQADTLRGLGCEYGQGYLWSAAVDADAAAALLQNNPWSMRSEQQPRTRRRPARLSDDPAVIRRAHDLHRLGASLHTIAAHLNSAGHLTSSGRRWHARTVARLLFDTTCI